MEGEILMDNQLALLTLCGSIIALLFVASRAQKVLRFPEGNDTMKKISASIHKGAMAYLRRQYKILIGFFAIMFVILFVMAALGLLTWFVPFAFVTGGFFSGLSGFIGMQIATRANARTAAACQKSLNKGLNVAFSAGSVMGFTVVGLGLLDISIWYLLLKLVFKLSIDDITSTMLTFGMGASSMALFARVGGGIYTKAADVGADLVGKVEAGIPEDDPRNPAVIADNVGDNVGDVAGMGADLYESYVGSILSACALGVIAFNKIESVDRVNAVVIPMVLAAVGVLASIIGSLLVKTGESTDQSTLLKALRRGTNTSAIIIAVVAFPLVWFILGKDFIGFYFAILGGLLAGVLIGFFTEYFTSDTYKPTQKLAGKSETGSATIIIGGLSLGMLSTAVPIIIIAVLDAEVRRRTDALDSLGNTTAATGKGFAIGSAALTALALIASYVEKVQEVGGADIALDMSVMNPTVLVGIFIGACLPFVFAALTMDSVGRAAQSIVVEVRRQFKEIKGLMEGKADADYETCVDICTKASLHEMILPTLLAIITPVVTGLILGYNGVIGLLTGATATGFLMAIFMANSGGAWDNAKKYIEGGNHGGKGSECHKAAVVGDTVGDPFKDTSGPSINILIKLLSMVSIVFAALVVNYHIF